MKMRFSLLTLAILAMLLLGFSVACSTNESSGAEDDDSALSSPAVIMFYTDN